MKIHDQFCRCAKCKPPRPEKRELMPPRSAFWFGILAVVALCLLFRNVS